MLAEGERIDLRRHLADHYRLARRREVLDEPAADDRLHLTVTGSAGPAQLAFALQTSVVLDPNERSGTRTLAEYSTALEVRSLIDVLVSVESGVSGVAFWVTVDYDDPRAEGSLKPDASFALRLAHAAKAERRVAAQLTELGHCVTGAAVLDPPYSVVIGKRFGGHCAANADLHCDRCGWTFEVKSRPYDAYLRISSSALRPFSEENRREGYQAFVIKHTSIRYFRNGDVTNWVADRSATGGQYDRYIEIPEQWARSREVASAELVCPGSALVLG